VLFSHEARVPVIKLSLGKRGAAAHKEQGLLAMACFSIDIECPRHGDNEQG